MKKFLQTSSTFSGVVFQGMYTMNTELFIRLFEYYQKTGINLLDDYSSIKYLEWDYNEGNKEFNYGYDNLNELDISQSNLRRSRIFNYEWLAEIRFKIKHYRSRHQKELELLRNKPRIEACKFTSKKETKEYIYKLYGKKCLCCDSTRNISLDHIVPVSKDGKNTLNNLQPLCKSCNSKKGTQTIDYRKSYG